MKKSKTILFSILALSFGVFSFVSCSSKKTSEQSSSNSSASSKEESSKKDESSKSDSSKKDSSTSVKDSSSSGGEVHTHTYSDAWNSDDSYHWHNATCEHTEEISGKEVHDFNMWVTDIYPTCSEKGLRSKTCKVCNYKVEEEIEPTGGHTYNNEIVDEKYLKQAATCQSKAVYYKSCSCGEIGIETFESGELLDHKYDAKGKCILDEFCDSDVSKTLTILEHNTEVSFKPVNDKIYFNFESIDEESFEVNTQMQQKLTEAITESTPCLFKSVKLFYENANDELVEVELERTSNNFDEYYFYSWSTTSKLLEQTQYYCEITLDTEQVDVSKDFLVYFYGINKYSDTLTFTQDDQVTWEKQYDENPYEISATASKAQASSIKYEYVEYNAYINEDKEFSDTAPTNVGHYIVRAYLDDAKYKGYIFKDYYIREKEVAIVSELKATYNGTKEYTVESGVYNISVKIENTNVLTPNSYANVYNGNNNFTIKIEDNNPNYKLVIDQANPITFVIEKIEVNLDGIYGIAYGSTSLAGTNLVSESQVTGVVQDISFGTPSLSINVEANQEVGVYDKNNFTGVTFSIDSPYYKLSDESDFKVIVYNETLGSGVFSNPGIEKNFEANKKQIFEISPTSSGIYLLRDSLSNQYSTSIIGVSPIKGQYYQLEAYCTYYVEAIKGTTYKEKVYLKRLDLIGSIFSSGGYKNSYSANSNNIFQVYHSVYGLYELTCDSNLEFTIEGVDRIGNSYYELPIGYYLVNIKAKEDGTDQIIKLAKVANNMVDITNDVLGSGYVSSYTGGETSYYKFDIEEAGIYKLVGDDFINVSIIEFPEINGNYYYLPEGTYHLSAYSMSTESSQSITLEFEDEPKTVTDITSCLLTEGSCELEEISSDSVYYYYVDIESAALYRLYIKGENATVSVLGKNPVNDFLYRLSSGRYILKVNIIESESNMSIFMDKIEVVNLTIGTQTNVVTSKDCEDVCIVMNLAASKSYCFDSEENSSIRPTDVSLMFKSFGDEVENDDYQSFSVAETGTYYLIVNVSNAGTYTIKIIETKNIGPGPGK